jgi:hypothetical protein
MRLFDHAIMFQEKNKVEVFGVFQEETRKTFNFIIVCQNLKCL